MRPPIVVYVPGVWDLLHRGHLNILWRAKRLGDVLVVGVVSDPGVKAYKGHFPAEGLGRRLQRVAALGFVDLVERQPTTDPTPVVRRIRPDILVHGDDWDRLKEGHETLAELGVTFQRLPYTEGISSSELRRAAAAGEPEAG